MQFFPGTYGLQYSIGRCSRYSTSKPSWRKSK